MAFRGPDRAALWQATRLVAACALGFGGTVVFGLHERFWALITAIIVTQPMLSDTLSAGRDRVVGTLVGAGAGFLVLELVRLGLPSLVLFWIALAPLAVLVAMFPYLRLSMVTLCVVVLVPSTDTSLARPFDRVVEILVGTAAAIIVAALVRGRPWWRPSGSGESR